MKKVWIISGIVFGLAVISFVGVYALVDNLFPKLENIRDVKPTRRMSVNDYPPTNTYYIIDIATATENYRYFVYGDGSRVYIEMPYQGIYKANRQFLDLIAKCLNNP